MSRFVGLGLSSWQRPFLNDFPFAFIELAEERTRGHVSCRSLTQSKAFGTSWSRMISTKHYLSAPAWEVIWRASSSSCRMTEYSLHIKETRGSEAGQVTMTRVMPQVRGNIRLIILNNLLRPWPEWVLFSMLQDLFIQVRFLKSTSFPWWVISLKHRPD